MSPGLSGIKIFLPFFANALKDKIKDLEGVISKMHNYKAELAQLYFFKTILNNDITAHFYEMHDKLENLATEFMDPIHLAILFNERTLEKAKGDDIMDLFDRKWEMAGKLLPTPDDVFLRIKMDASITSRLYEILQHRLSAKVKPLYEIEGLHEKESGFFGTVYKGSHQDVEVAVKFLMPDKSHEQSLVDFASEIVILSKLSKQSPLVVNFLAADPFNLCFVMEFMEGGNLQNFLLEKALPWHLKLSIASQVTAGLQFLHKYNTYHCDLKTQNILLTIHENNKIQCKITDFGFSLYKRTNAMQDESRGTFAYMAPELFTFPVDYSVKSDIYALGVVLWEIGMQRIPYKSTASSKIKNLTITNVRLELDNLPGNTHAYVQEYTDLIRCCWHEDPNARYPLLAVTARITRIQMQNFIADGPQHMGECEQFLVDQELKFTLLHYAAQMGDLFTVKNLLNNQESYKLDANVQTWTKLTPLYLAAKHGHSDIVEELLRQRADPNKVADTNGNTPLLIAAQEGHREIVEKLIQGGAAVNAVNKVGETPLLLAAAFGHMRIVEVLLERGANLNAKCKELTPLTLAWFCGEELGMQTKEVVEFLKSREANETPEEHYNQLEWWSIVHDLVDKARMEESFEMYLGRPLECEGGITALYVALKYGNFEAAVSLYSPALYENIPALHFAALHGQVGIVSDILCGRWLQSKKHHHKIYPSIEDVNLLPTSPLGHAVCEKHNEVVAILLQHEHGIGKHDDLGGYLYTATERGDTQLVEILLEHSNKISTEAKDKSLISAINGGFTEIARKLIEKGALVNSSRVFKTPLHFAASCGRPEIVELLCENGADVNSKYDLIRNTPLHEAAYHGHAKVAEILLNYGAEVNKENDSGETPLYVATSREENEEKKETEGEERREERERKRKGKEEVAKLLREHGGVAEFHPTKQYWRLKFTHF